MHDAIKAFFKGEMVLKEQSDVYDIRSFDPIKGKIIYSRPICIAKMEDLFLHKRYETEWNITNCVVSIQDLRDYCVNNNIKFLMAFGPIYKNAFEDSGDAQGMLSLQKRLTDSIDVQFVNSIAESLVPEEYCYNGARHLNDVGTRYYSNLLGDKLKEIISK